MKKLAVRSQKSSNKENRVIKKYSFMPPNSKVTALEIVPRDLNSFSSSTRAEAQSSKPSKTRRSLSNISKLLRSSSIVPKHQKKVFLRLDTNHNNHKKIKMRVESLKVDFKKKKVFLKLAIK